MRSFLLFTIEDRRFALDLAAVQRVVQMVEFTAVPDAPASVAGLLIHQGEPVPVFDLRRRFGLPPRSPLPSDHLLIARAGERGLALPVDAAEGILELPEADLLPLEGMLPGIEVVEGTAAVSGELVLVLAPGRFFSEMNAPEKEAAHAPYS